MASDGHSSDSERQESDGASYSYLFKYTNSKLHLIDDFINDDHDETLITSGSGTQPRASWNALQNDGDFDD